MDKNQPIPTPEGDENPDDGNGAEDEVIKKYRINDVPAYIVSESEAIYGENGKFVANHSANLMHLIQKNTRTLMNL